MGVLQLVTTVSKVEELQKEEQAIVSEINEHAAENSRPLEIAGTPLEVTEHVFERRKEALNAELDARDRLVSNLREQRDELNKRIAAEMAMRHRAHTALEVLETAIASLKTVIAESVDELFSQAYNRERRATEGSLLPEEGGRSVPKLSLKAKSKKQAQAAAAEEEEELEEPLDDEDLADDDNEDA